MKITTILLCATITLLFTACDLVEDTDLNPIYFMECEIDGQYYRAQTNDEAFLNNSVNNPDSYIVTGHDIPADFHVDLYLFRSLGEGKIATGIEVNTLLTSIGLFMDGKSYSAVLEGGGGCVTIDFLSDDRCEGTFEGTVVELWEETEKRVITNGSFKVKTKR